VTGLRPYCFSHAATFPCAATIAIDAATCKIAQIMPHSSIATHLEAVGQVLLSPTQQYNCDCVRCLEELGQSTDS